MTQTFPVIVKKLKKLEDKDVKVEDGVLDDYAPKFVQAPNAQAARDLVFAELVTAGAYDAADPMHKIEVCSPFSPVASTQY